MVMLTKHNIVEEAEKFRASTSLAEYFSAWGIDKMRVNEHMKLDLDKAITTHEEAMLFAKFCQRYWECLPDRAEIRHGAFFTLCDFAEYHCFGGEE